MSNNYIKTNVSELIEWIKGWSWDEITYAVIASIIFAIIGLWGGLFKWCWKKVIYKFRIAAYKKALKTICSSLIVVGRREGFSIKDVFINLDVVKSDLNLGEATEKVSLRKNYVLVGGPGAGKSTYVKKIIIDHLFKNNSKKIPFYVRLREYDPNITIEEHIIDQFTRHHVPDAELTVRSILYNGTCICVLDGLDEVSPELKEMVFVSINLFYGKYFSAHNNSGQLIVTCRKEAYRNLPLSLNNIYEVRPLTDEQIQYYAEKWPLGYPDNKNKETFWRDLSAAPKILELARSPLLLTGGLMQYTESNLGIPEERVEYLERIGKWLISEWATAQGHTPDKYRQVYKRVLPILAFEMHKAQKSEFGIDNVIRLLETWLPEFGFEANEAKNVIENVMLRTGILVRDSPSSVVFSQFGLQEYFASIHANDVLNSKTLAAIQPKNWWREVVLLAIAQQKDPTTYLNELFKTDAILAAVSVAECSTPSIIQQEKAIDAVINGLDNNDKYSSAAAISLLRKLNGIQEEQFIKQLENRLHLDENKAETIGVVLATADTDSASLVLTRHPSIWSICFKSVGFLSNNLEKLLISWIRNGDLNQSKLAIELISPRLSRDRFKQLIEIVPLLEENRRELLAKNLLLYLENGYSKDHFTFENDPKYLHYISTCSSFIKHRNDFLSRGEQTVSLQFGRDENITVVSLFLTRKNNQTDKKFIYNNLKRSLDFVKYGKAFVALIFSTMLILLFDVAVEISLIFVALNAALIIAMVTTYTLPPWYSRVNFSNSSNFVVGIIFLLGFISPFLYITDANFTSSNKNFNFYLIYSWLYAILSLVLIKQNLIWISFSFKKIVSRLSTIMINLWLSCLGTLTLLKIAGIDCSKYFLFFSISFFIYFSVYYIVIYISYTKVEKARILSEKHLINLKK